MTAFFGFGTRFGSLSLLASESRASRGEISIIKVLRAGPIRFVLDGDEAPTIPLGERSGIRFGKR